MKPRIAIPLVLAVLCFFTCLIPLLGLYHYLWGIDTVQETITLQREYTADRSTCFSVNVKYTLITHHHADASTYILRDLQLFVDEDKANGLGRQLVIFPFKDVWQVFTFGTPPLWTRGYVLPTTFHLPTGRLFMDRQSRMHFILVRNDRCEIYDCVNEPSQHLTPATSPADLATLREFYNHAFAPDDVYWSYALVQCSDFFGIPNPTPVSGLCSITDLFEKWTQLKTTNAPSTMNAP